MLAKSRYVLALAVAHRPLLKELINTDARIIPIKRII